MADTISSEPMWFVLDSNARDRKNPRFHEVAPGEGYALSAYEKCKMPKAHALVFLRDTAFVVFDEAGQQVRALPKAAISEGAALQLEPGQTVAEYDELLDDALLARALMRPGGSQAEGMTRAALIAFLNNTPLVGELPPEQRARDTGTPENDEVMTDKEAAALLPRSTDDMLMGR